MLRCVVPHKQPHCLQHAGPWRLDCSPVHRLGMHGASNRDSHLYSPHNSSSVQISTIIEVRRSGGSPNVEWLDNTTRVRTFIPDTGSHPPGMALPRRAVVRLKHLRTDVGRFHSCLYKWGMASSAVCECGAKEQTVDDVVLQCPIHRPPHGLHSLTVLNDETIEWLLNICPEILCGQAVGSNNSLKRRSHKNSESKSITL